MKDPKTMNERIDEIYNRHFKTRYAILTRTGLSGQLTEVIHELFHVEVVDQEVYDDHWQRTPNASFLDLLYFPQIDYCLQLDQGEKWDQECQKEHEQVQEMILLELITLSSVLEEMGYQTNECDL